MYSQEGGGNGQGEQEVTSPSHYIFEQFQNSYQFRILFTNPEKIFELLCPFSLIKKKKKKNHLLYIKCSIGLSADHAVPRTASLQHLTASTYCSCSFSADLIPIYG